MSLVDSGDIHDTDIIPPDDILEYYASANDHKKAAVSSILQEDTRFIFAFLHDVDPNDMTKNAGNTLYWAGREHIQTLIYMMLSLFTLETEEPEFRLACLRGVSLFILSLPEHVKYEFQEILRQYGEKKGT